MDAMHLYKRGPTWWLRFKDHRGFTRRLRGSTNKRVAEGISRQVAHLIECAAGGVGITDDLADWLQTLDEKRRGKLVAWGLIAEVKLVAGEAIADLLDRWETGLRARGRSAAYAAVRRRAAERLFEACGVRLYRDIDAEAVLATLDEWRRDGKVPGDWRRHTDVSEITLAHYLSCVKAFTRWMQRHRYASRDALAVLSVDRRPARPGASRSIAAQRRALTEAEQVQLVRRTAASSDDRYGIAPADRAILYRFALGTGLRQGAIRRLVVGDVSLEEAFVAATGSGAGNKTSSPKPLTSSLVQALAKHIEGRHEQEPLFHMPHAANVANMLRADCEAAGVSTTGVDFHALRHTFGTTLARRGTHPKTLMTLMDHATIQMTMRLYTHSFPEDQTRAVEQLPDLDGTGPDARAAAG